MFEIRYGTGRVVRCVSYDAALVHVRAEYPGGVVGHSGDLSDGGERTLFWPDAEAANGDDGARATGKIVRCAR